jgi:hypothetical protein
LLADLQYIFTKVDPVLQERSALGVIRRTLPERWKEFDVRVRPELSPSKYEDAFAVRNSAKSKAKILRNRNDNGH